jgi:hypothetical protein
MEKATSAPTRTVGPVRLSYTQNLFTPKAFRAGDTPRYGLTIMFEKSDPAHQSALKQLAADAKMVLESRWPNPTTRPRVPIVGGIDSVIKDADKAVNRQGIPMLEKNPEYAGHYIIRLGTISRPPVIDRNMQEILDPEEIYGGVWAKVALNAYTFSGDTNKGVTFGLNGVQKWKDDERFGGGRPPVAQMFEPAPAGSEDPSSYDDFDLPPAAAAAAPKAAAPAPAADDDFPF